ncbi:nuclear transport factor 2 family protein [Conexibacter sp. JD483]|uniref:nuclear transport factor 2 family protein n=1 Tax=unclassified Conexibacter TaxID=2627773 RepID=UPI002721BA36|nr:MULTISPECIES: nuclear transport factor 2 family protein [unclassified Conexibacter]MDO8188647.1 nuclear transport factor 2 family protein [Conexibacter sp. CPCC 205706]MDO8201517.1 nuclear transport factor 2 family protein [Conexibacter sp. CPCC 205762]MDR9370736.1 nuclear transport factor 2 family protein [Conexibacter sp. JD483]
MTFREAVEARDLAAVEAMLADDVVFRSPVAFKPYPGKAITAAILRAVIEVFEDFHYVREIGDADGVDHALVFEARVDGLAITGCDFLRYDDDGRIADFMVMVRPLRAAEALAARMTARFEQIQRAATGASHG